MTPVSPDHELVSAYAKEGSEAAFRSLVARHVDLVYATALRQVGDPGIAEEVTQNVFVALARKAPRLAGLETLAGWLHRTALLEAKARIRAELRRQRREDAAARLAVVDQPHGEPENPFTALVPLLDEALLQLRDTDRVALVLRFLEDRSLRDVGTALGVEEDAARKRVSRALERVTAFFRQRGFPIGAGAAAVFAQATQAAPAALTITATQAGLAVGGTATGLNLLLLHLMSLTKTQTAVICAVLVAAPLAYQQQAVAKAERNHAQLAASLAETEATLASLNARLAREQNTLLRAQSASVTAEARLAELENQRAKLAASQPYHWDDTSPFIRVPKEYLKEMAPSGMKNIKGDLSEAIVVALQMTDTERTTVEQATHRFLDRLYVAQKETTKTAEPDEADIGNRKQEDVRVFVVGDVEKTFSTLRQELFASWEQALGGERTDRLKEAVKRWMPVEGEYVGLGTETGIFVSEHRLRFYREFQRLETPTGETSTMGYGVALPGGSAYWATIGLDEIPSFLRPQLADWIEEAKRSPLVPLEPAP